jgi:hypothetical protein
MTEERLHLIWSKHRDLLPARFDDFRAQRARGMGTWCCPGCGVVFESDADWQQKTGLVEAFEQIPGGNRWERRRCPCGAVRALPVREKRGGDDASTGNR